MCREVPVCQLAGPHNCTRSSVGKQWSLPKTEACPESAERLSRIRGRPLPRLDKRPACRYFLTAAKR